jgi:hypothetical protein
MIQNNKDQSQVSMLFAQMVAAIQPAAKRAERYNPRPKGTIQKGSATDAVLDFLTKSPGLKTEAQICWATKRSHSAVSWALIRLRSWKRIDAIEDPSRNSRYFRYRISKEKP